MAYHGATYPKVMRWLSFFEGKKRLEDVWRTSLSEMLQRLELPRSGRIGKEGILDVEKAIHQEKILLIRSLMRYESKVTQDVLRVYLSRYEIKNLVNLVLSFVYHRPGSILYELGKGFRVQPPFVNDLKDLKELQSFLLGTPYYRLAQQIFPEIEKTGESFGLEVRLYEMFLESLVEAVRRSGEWDAWRETLLFGIEMERIMFVARMKFGYRRSAEEVLAYFPAVFEERGYWRRLLNSESLEEFIRLLPSSLGLTGGENLQKLSQIIQQRVVTLLWPMVRRAGSARFLGAFLVIQEIMTQNWQIALEAQRYKLPWEEVSPFIVEGGGHVVF
ncbi:V0D/AC39 family V-type ATPase subunit [Thermospira aquatica]|uniref:V-type ATPase subunit n=1 Tax=Thermospira aquatica TaxID=2828656 RepID=A0AAX3BCY0_9SPIR|nr:V-type ATPase subunit [Thermospira aquatica]URA10116.1 V-type ATPase subunit [Thermospira aquatica]